MTKKEPKHKKNCKSFDWYTSGGGEMAIGVHHFDCTCGADQPTPHPELKDKEWIKRFDEFVCDECASDKPHLASECLGHSHRWLIPFIQKELDRARQEGYEEASITVKQLVKEARSEERQKLAEKIKNLMKDEGLDRDSNSLPALDLVRMYNYGLKKVLVLLQDPQPR